VTCRQDAFLSLERVKQVLTSLLNGLTRATSYPTDDEFTPRQRSVERSLCSYTEAHASALQSGRVLWCSYNSVYGVHVQLLDRSRCVECLWCSVTLPAVSNWRTKAAYRMQCSSLIDSADDGTTAVKSSNENRKQVFCNHTVHALQLHLVILALVKLRCTALTGFNRFHTGKTALDVL